MPPFNGPAMVLRRALTLAALTASCIAGSVAFQGQKDQRINIRLSSGDLQAIRTRAMQEGIPYQTLISSVLHKYVSGTLQERTTTGGSGSTNSHDSMGVTSTVSGSAPSRSPQ